MTRAKTNYLHRALYRILRPLTRLLLRNGVPFAEFSELVKQAYVEAALEDASGGRKKPTDSRAAVMTGLTRKEVKRLREMLVGEHNNTPPGSLHANRASRVVAGWVHDPAFSAGGESVNQPATLPFDGDLSFTTLVRRYSGDMPPRAVLDELMRVGVVATDPDSGHLMLMQRAYVPIGDSAEMLNIFGEDVSDLIATIDHNLVSSDAGRQPLFQRTLTYNNIPPEIMSRWRKHAAEQAMDLLVQLDGWIGPHDRDVAAGKGGASTDGHTGPRKDSVRTGVSIFYFEEPIQPDGQGDEQA